MILYSQINQIATDAVMHRHKLTDQAAKDTNANTRHLDLRTDISLFKVSKHFFCWFGGFCVRSCFRDVNIQETKTGLKGMQRKEKEEYKRRRVDVKASEKRNKIKPPDRSLFISSCHHPCPRIQVEQPSSFHCC